jgi:hypothetical protein
VVSLFLSFLWKEADPLSIRRHLLRRCRDDQQTTTRAIMQRKNRPPRSGDEGGVFSTVSLSSSSFDDDSHNDNIIFNEGGDDERANRKLVFTATAAAADDDDDNGRHISSRRGDVPSNTNTTAVQDTAYNIEMTASSSQTISKAPGLAAAAAVQQSSSDDTSSPSLVEGLLLLPPGSTTTTAATTTATATTVTATATVKRNRYGTRPFDIHWLNIDCCGLLCAAFTYTLHMYGMYAYCLVLLPPWLSSMNDDGYRTLSASCYVNRSVFCTISCLAMYSHYCAMLTNPGAVPPDALPLPTSDDDDDDDYEGNNKDNVNNNENTMHVDTMHVDNMDEEIDIQMSLG